MPQVETPQWPDVLTETVLRDGITHYKCSTMRGKTERTNVYVPGQDNLTAADVETQFVAECEADGW